MSEIRSFSIEDKCFGHRVRGWDYKNRVKVFVRDGIVIGRFSFCFIVCLLPVRSPGITDRVSDRRHSGAHKHNQQQLQQTHGNLRAADCHGRDYAASNLDTCTGCQSARPRGVLTPRACSVRAIPASVSTPLACISRTTARGVAFASAK